MRMIILGLWLLALLAPGCKKRDERAATESSAQPSAPLPEAKRKTAPAHQFLPAGCDVSGVVNAAAVLANPYLQKELLLGVDPSRTPVAEQTDDQKAFFAFLKEANLELGADLHEVAFCVFQQAGPADAPPQADFMVAISGNLPDGLLPKLKTALPEQNRYETVELGGRPSLHREGRWLLQTASGTLLFSNAEARLMGALTPQKHFSQYRLHPERAISAVGSSSMASELTTGSLDPLAKAFSGAQRFEVSVDFQKGQTRVEGHADTRDAAAAAVAKQALQAKVQQIILEAESAPPMVKALLGPSVTMAQAAQFTVEGSRVSLSMNVPEGLLEGMLQQFSQLGSRARPRPGRSPSPVSSGAAGLTQPGLRAAPAPSASAP